MKRILLPFGAFILLFADVSVTHAGDTKKQNEKHSPQTGSAPFINDWVLTISGRIGRDGTWILGDSEFTLDQLSAFVSALKNNRMKIGFKLLIETSLADDEIVVITKKLGSIGINDITFSTP